MGPDRTPWFPRVNPATGSKNLLGRGCYRPSARWMLPRRDNAGHLQLRAVVRAEQRRVPRSRASAMTSGRRARSPRCPPAGRSRSKGERSTVTTTAKSLTDLSQRSQTAFVGGPAEHLSNQQVTDFVTNALARADL